MQEKKKIVSSENFKIRLITQEEKRKKEQQIEIAKKDLKQKARKDADIEHDNLISFNISETEEIEDMIETIKSLKIEKAKLSQDQKNLESAVRECKISASPAVMLAATKIKTYIENLDSNGQEFSSHDSMRAIFDCLGYDEQITILNFAFSLEDENGHISNKAIESGWISNSDTLSEGHFIYNMYSNPMTRVGAVPGSKWIKKNIKVHADGEKYAHILSKRGNLGYSVIETSNFNSAGASNLNSAEAF